MYIAGLSAMNSSTINFSSMSFSTNLYQRLLNPKLQAQTFQTQSLSDVMFVVQEFMIKKSDALVCQFQKLGM